MRSGLDEAILPVKVDVRDFCCLFFFGGRVAFVFGFVLFLYNLYR